MAEFWERVGRGGAADIDGLLLELVKLEGGSTASPLGEVTPLSLPPAVELGGFAVFKLDGLEPRRVFLPAGAVGATVGDWTEAVESISVLNVSYQGEVEVGGESDV